MEEKEELNAADLKFMLSIPIKIPDSNKQIEIGRYGLYIKDGSKNIKVDKKEWDKIYNGDLSALC